ncbi:tyrosine-type recombinase/integrase [Halomonas sp. YLGW01]|uniref:tyrosine-type recombinase/integrase n=1 Tax=Halomonas sp. YLGW01 TaxID=2773308 RepID=UPI001F5B9893|nr:tyrosine-type recombinase/integrase [Halomonas sp. YLGW01]
MSDHPLQHQVINIDYQERYGDVMPDQKEGLTPEAQRLLAESVSHNTIRAMRADIRVYLSAGFPLPATEPDIANFLSDQNKLGKKPATLIRYANSLHMWHRYMGVSSPARTMTIRSILRGIKKTRDMRQASAPALRLAELHVLLEALDRNTLRGLRDSALFALSFYGAFRRSEIVGLRVDDLDWQPKGVTIRIRYSKTNQAGRIENKSIMQATQETSYCPVTLLKAWLSTSGISRGAIFRSITLGDHIGSGPLTDQTVSDRMKVALEKTSLTDRGYTPHSFRAGFITEAHLRGKSDTQIKRISGHRSQRTFEQYIRIADEFEDHAGDFFS